MAAITVTSTGVKPIESAGGHAYSRGVAGEALSAGDPVYLSADRKYMKVDPTDQNKVAIVGIAMNTVSTDQRLEIMTSGTVDLGSALSDAVCVVVAGDGTLEEIADLATGEYIVVVGFSVGGYLLLNLLNLGDTA